jgi:hypothetical protein
VPLIAVGLVATTAADAGVDTVTGTIAIKDKKSAQRTKRDVVLLDL